VLEEGPWQDPLLSDGCYNGLIMTMAIMAPMHAELLTIGSELVSGATINTNAAYLARRLGDAGIRCDRQVAVGDAPGPLAAALRDALARARLVVVTGGLGPTFDDITMAAIADVTGRRLRYVPRAAETIRRFYSRRHRVLQQAALRQAYLPEGGRALHNPIGTAPGLWLASGGRIIVALPGVPSEMRAMTERQVLPRLRRLRGRQPLESRTLRTVGLVELSIERVLRTLAIPSTVQVGLYPNVRMVDVRLTATGTTVSAAQRVLDRLERALRRALGPAVYGTGDETLEAVVGRLLAGQRKTLALAESCTGGLLAHRITNVPGSSRYLRGGVVAYHDDLKRGCLGVPPGVLARSGAVSAPVVRAMAAGVRRLADADVALAVTGIAGPSGATSRKPVGLVYIGLADRRRTLTQRCRFFGDRETVKFQAAQTALDWLRRYLLSAR